MAAISTVHVMQFGLQGHVGCFDAVDGARHPRDSNVICRTHRGLEVGRVLAGDVGGAQTVKAGELLRRLTPDDELLVERINRYRDRAFRACQRLLVDRNIPAILVDVEHLFDGQSLFFYFLGQSGPELDRLTAELADTYEKKVRFRQFVRTLVAGCGPDCGTGDSKCSAGRCSTCQAHSHCGLRSGGD